MSPGEKAPPVDRRRASDVERRLLRRVPFYTPEWPAEKENDPGRALVDAFSVIAEGVIEQLNRAPDRDFLEFLNMLGIDRLPARPARVPVQFRVNPNLEGPVLVPRHAQCSAPATETRPEDLPFETDGYLLAVPSRLTDLVAVDPEEDAVYRPPPGFLELEREARPVPPHRTVSLSAAGSRTLQLDRVEELEKGDILRIPSGVPSGSGAVAAGGCRGTGPGGGPAGVRDLFLEVADDPDGRIVGLTEPLDAPVPTDTEVRKVTDFAVFDAKDLQEHGLYLGHADLLNVESEAEIHVRIRHLPGTATNLSRLPLAWEYGMEPESGDGVEWRPLEVLDDTTVGFRSDGRLRLLKPEGEIVETEVAGASSRWIRARVDGPVPATPRPRLPRLDAVTFAVRSAGAPIPPDALFHNEAPLELPGRPFGPEPRQFDRFYIGSQEVFSKREADVTLDVGLLQDMNLASPASVALGGSVHTFARGPGGRLVEVRVPGGGAPGGAPERVTHDEIEGTSIAFESTPAAAAIEGPWPRLFAFVRTEDGDVHELFGSPLSTQRTWIPLDAPDGGALYDPAVALEDGAPRVFVVGGDAALHSVRVSRWNGSAGEWSTHLLPGDLAGRTLASSPTAVALDGEIRVYVSDARGRILELDPADGSWVEVGNTALVGADERAEAGDPDHRPRSQPAAACFDEGGTLVTRLAYRDGAGRLHALRIEARTLVEERDLGRPTLDGTPTGTTVASSPAVILPGGGADPGEGLHLFVRDSADQLWHRGPLAWHSLDRPGAADLRLAPSAVIATTSAASHVRVFLAQEDRLAEYALELESGTARGGPLRTLVLAGSASSDQDAYRFEFVHIRHGPGADDVLRVIARYGGPDRVLRLEDAAEPWSAQPTTASQYVILDADPQAEGTTAGFGSDTVTLDAEPVFVGDRDELLTGPGLAIRVFDAGGTPQVRRISDIPDATTVDVDRDWDDPLEDTNEQVAYEIFEILDEGAVHGSADRALALGPGSRAGPEADGVYAGSELRILQGAAAGEAEVVASYSGVAQVALLTSPLASVPDGTSVYRVLAGLGWDVHEDPHEQDLRPQLSWEYWNGAGWLGIRGLEDGTGNFLRSGEVAFRVPADLEAVEVAGQEGFWIRARLVSGDFGREVFSVVETETDPETTVHEVRSTKEGIDPPLIRELTISYVLAVPQRPRHCVTRNNLTFLDQTAACNTPGKHFAPFLPLEDPSKTVYLGFEKPLSGGPIGILFAAAERRTEEADAPKMVWSVRSGNAWKDLRAEDGTSALTRQGVLTFQVDPDVQRRTMFGESRYWVRGSLDDGRYLEHERPRLAGVFPNAAMTVQAGTVRDEILGSSDGEPGQEFVFLRAADGDPPPDWSILGDPEIRVRESLSPEEREALAGAAGDRPVVREAEVPGGNETWVLWTPVTHLSDSSPTDRHYRLDAAAGRILFGDGERGMIPPPGVDNVRAFAYRTGGGDQGNVGTGEVDTLVTAVAGVDSVLNPVPAGGGGDRASVGEMREIGPARVSHRGRAVTPGDFEWLAREASRSVARARCRPNFDAGADPDDEGRVRPGWVTVYIVPREDEAASTTPADGARPGASGPRPSLELQRAVRRHLEAAADAGLAAAGRIVVRPPRYVPVSVEATVVASSLDGIAVVERAVADELKAFLHPLTGGPEGEGWAFGRPVAVSDVFTLLEAVEGVDHVGGLRLHVAGATESELARVGPDQLVAWGEPTIHMDVVRRAP